MSETQHPESAEGGKPPRSRPARNGERRAKQRKGEEAAPDEASKPPPDQEPDPDEEPQLLPLGNPLRPLRGTALLVAGAFSAFCLMAVAGQYRFGVPLAALAVLVAAFGALDLAGTFDDPDDRIAGRATLAQLARPLGLFLGGGLSRPSRPDLPRRRRPALGSPLPRRHRGRVLVPASFMVTVVGAYQIANAFGVWAPPEGQAPLPLHRRHGFWLVLIATLLYLPLLGSHSLSDPWETHYGEVSREILARNDWISTWWAQDGWFWSKPVLDFWIQALAMATFGVRYHSNDVLGAVREGRIPWPEWAVRLPVFLLTLLAVYLLYKAVARVFGRRAGLLGGIVLVTMPQWFLLSNQTMTDMPFVAPMAAAMACLLLGAHADPDEEVRVHELDLEGRASLRFSGYVHAGSRRRHRRARCPADPLYLVSAQRSRSRPRRLGFHFRLDAFSAGSPGNCGLPGNEACHAASPVVRGLHPALQALIWAQALALVVYLNWGERRRQRLWFLAAWLFAAVSTLAKGPAGLGLPALCALAYLVASGALAQAMGGLELDLIDLLLRALTLLEIPSGLLILLAVALPWYVAMYARHGQPFTDRLLFHDMFKRAFTHVHDTNEGDDVSFRFYVWQLGYAMFPWTGLVPAGLLYWLKWREEDDKKADASVFLVTWFLLAFGLFSLMLTKFHHYILPAVPPAAMLTGVLLDAMLDRVPEAAGRAGRAPPIEPRRRRSTTRGVYVARSRGGSLGRGAGRRVRHGGMAFGPHPGGFISADRRRRRRGRAWLGDGGRSVIFFGHVMARPSSDDELAFARDPSGSRSGARVFRDGFEIVQLGAAGIAGAILVLAVGRDLSANLEGLPNQIRLWHLVTYNYRRPWPPSLDFTPTLWAFTAAAARATLALVEARVRRHVVVGLVSLGVVFGAWGLDVYFMKIAPHWGQRETTLAYYQASREAPGPLVAYQMNWKGENFYTGNHVPAFVSSGKKFQDYILDEKKKGVRTFYFVTEHGRTGTLSNELGATKEFEKLTAPELDNKFVLVRARFE